MQRPRTLLSQSEWRGGYHSDFGLSQWFLTPSPLLPPPWWLSVGPCHDASAFASNVWDSPPGQMLKPKSFRLNLGSRSSTESNISVQSFGCGRACAWSESWVPHTPIQYLERVRYELLQRLMTIITIWAHPKRIRYSAARELHVHLTRHLFGHLAHARGTYY